MAEKIFNNVQHLFPIGLEASQHRGNVAERCKCLCTINLKPVLSGKNLKTCLEIHKHAHSRCPYSTVLKVLPRSTQEQERKALKVGKEVNVWPFADNIILFLKDLNETTRNLLYLINDFYSVIRYKTNIQKPGALLHSTNEVIKKEEKKQLYL